MEGPGSGSLIPRVFLEQGNALWIGTGAGETVRSSEVECEEEEGCEWSAGKRLVLLEAWLWRRQR